MNFNFKRIFILITKFSFSPNLVETISKYFKKTTTTKIEKSPKTSSKITEKPPSYSPSSSLTAVSPTSSKEMENSYNENAIKGLLNDSSDFETPKLKKVIVKTKKNNNTNNSKKRKTKRNKNQKLIPDSWKIPNDLDVNPDHLQMALALSISLQEQEEESSNGSRVLMKNNVMTTLEQYGFKKEKKKLQVENRRTNYEVGAIYI